LLLLHGTSAATGRRLITMALDPAYTPAGRCPTGAPLRVTSEIKAKSLTKQAYVTEEPGQGCPIFMEATRFHTLLTNDTNVDFWAGLQRLFLWEYIREKLPFIFPRQNLDDIRLSTAAHNSARFPVISPPGAVRNIKHNVVDRIVDGGYIENYGAITAMELAVAIHAARRELAPFVLVISNDPDENPDLNRIEVPDTVFLTDVSIPVEAIANTRTGRGRLAVLQLNSVLDLLTRSSCGADTVHVRVWPQYVERASGGSEEKTSRPVSMSWWLSTPVQIHLHQQTEGVKNQNQNGSEMEKTWQALENTSACMTSALDLLLRRRCPQDRSQPVNFLFHQGSECFRSAPLGLCDLGSERSKALLHGFLAEAFVQGLGELVDDGLRRALRCEHCIEGRAVELRQPLLI